MTSGSRIPSAALLIASSAAMLVGFEGLGLLGCAELPRSGRIGVDLPKVEEAARRSETVGAAGSAETVEIVETVETVETAEFRKEVAYTTHLGELEERVAGRGFHALIEKPFVVVGDESRETVALRSRRTVRWAVRLLKKGFFAKDPEHILDIWLFKNRSSYLKHTREFFGERPSTPFGYYAPSHRALIMNIKTGGGTLVHEIVHPLMEANFPDCPAWFNEGMGSLFEQCAEREGQIVGLTNWRLKGLQEAVRAESVPTFAALTATTTGEFYDADPGTNYAQARYLCFYLQERGLLRRFYREFVRDQKRDPTGYRTLRRVLGFAALDPGASNPTTKQDPEMAGFEARWRAFVLKLSFR